MTQGVKNLLDKIIFLCFAGLVVLTPLVYTTKTTELFEVPKMLIVYGLSTFVLTATFVKFIIEKKITLPKGPLIYVFLTFLAFQTLSTFFSLDKFTSIFGYPTRLNGGLVSQFSYFAIFACALINLQKAKRETLIALSVFTAFVVSLWGIPSHFGYDPNCLILVNKLTSTCWQAEFQPTLRIFSTLGQPNWLASYLVLVFPFSLAFLISAKSNLHKIIYSLCTLALFLAFIFTNSRSGLAGMAVAIVIFVCLLGKKFLGRHLKILIPVSVIVILISLFFGTTLIGRLLEIPSGQTEGGTETGRIRKVVWNGAWQVFLKNPLLGTGPETFAFSYQKLRPTTANSTTEWNFFYNKAHNELLNYLANVGIVGLLLYLLLLYLSLKTIHHISTMTEPVILSETKNLKNRSFGPQSGSQDDSVGLLAKGAFAAIIGYQVVIFFGFSVVATQTLMYLLIASLVACGNPPVKQVAVKLSRFGSFACISLILVTGLWLLTITFRIYFSDALLNRAKSSNSPQFSTLTFQNSLVTFPGNNPYITSDFATYTSVFGNSDSKTSARYLKMADNLATRSYQKAPNNFLVIRRLVNVYTIIGPGNDVYEKQGAVLAQRLIELAPTDPQSYFTAAKFYAAVGDNKLAVQNLTQALKLKADYAEAQELLNQIEP